MCLLCVVGSFPCLAPTCLLPISAGEDGDKKRALSSFFPPFFFVLSLSLYTHYNGVWEEEEQMRANDSFGLAKKRRRRPPISSYRSRPSSSTQHVGTHAKNGGPQKRPLLATDSPPLGVQKAPAPNLLPTVLLLAQDKGKVGACTFFEKLFLSSATFSPPG